MRRLLFYMVAGLFIVPIESYFLGRFGVAKPDFALLIVYFAGLLYAEGEGVLVGGLLGIIIDLFYGGILGVNFFSKALTGYIVGSLGSNFQNVNVGFNIISIFAVSLFDLMITFFLMYLFNKNIFFNESLTTIILPTAFYTTIAGALLCTVFSEKIYKIRDSQ